jgi:hypothetical protein
MEDAAWSPYDSSFRSPYLAGDLPSQKLGFRA